MDSIIAAYKRRLEKIRSKVINDELRRIMIFKCFNMILCFVSAFMTVVNVFTGKWLLMCSTLVFSLACLLNVLLSKRSGTIRLLANYLFLTEGMVLCGFFCISGTPEGFSALWTCFIPSFSLTLLGIKKGCVYSSAGFLMVAFLFWTPAGRSMLRYGYTTSFKLRFPMIYLAFFLMAVFLESVRHMTHKQLLEAEQRYVNLYKHDALTGIYNRYGFNELMDEIFASNDVQGLALFILDLDFFKNVNDTYGHGTGDIVLKFVADMLTRMTGDNAVACRWGGEEFTVLAWDEPDPLGLAERIRQECEASRITAEDGQSIRITVSIGVCIVPQREGATIAQVVKHADRCLYQAKEEGRNRVASVCLNSGYGEKAAGGWIRQES